MGPPLGNECCAGAVGCQGFAGGGGEGEAAPGPADGFLPEVEQQIQRRLKQELQKQANISPEVR